MTLDMAEPSEHENDVARSTTSSSASGVEPKTRLLGGMYSGVSLSEMSFTCVYVRMHACVHACMHVCEWRACRSLR